MVDLSASVSGIKFNNPTVLPAGILGVTASSIVRAAFMGAGAVTSKSVGPERREGHKNPVVVELDGSLLNAVGLSCPSLDESVEELKNAVKATRVPVIASFYGRTVEEFGLVAERISEAKPAFIEANISCPNIEDDFGKPFGTSCELAAKVTAEVKNLSRIPLIVKLTPNVSDIKSIALSVEEAGADCIAAVNTVGPGMYIDVLSAKPVLSNRAGGLSGPAIRPIAVRCVYDIYEAVDVPIIGMGGVSSGRDAAEMLLAGASAVGIGTAVWKRGEGVFKEVCRELEKIIEERGDRSLKDLIGKAHN